MADKTWRLTEEAKPGARGARGAGKAREYKTKFPRGGARGATRARASFKRWQDAIPLPRPGRNPDSKIKAVRPTRAVFDKLRAVANSTAAPAEMLNQKLAQDQLFGTLFSALATYEYMKAKGALRARTRGGRASERDTARWGGVAAGFSAAFAAAGMPGVTEADLDRFVAELKANRANLDAVIRIANSGVPDRAPRNIRALSVATASFVPFVDKVIDPSIIITPIRNLCDSPLAQGTFTKHFSHSISLSVSISYPCGISWTGIKWCKKTVTLAGVSVSFDVNVGYKVNCCGATVWGQASSQVCATIVGITVCAGCKATIIGVAGISRTPVASGCSYGLGINATLVCTFAGATILNLSYPFGWTVTGPCPPAGLCP